MKGDLEEKLEELADLIKICLKKDDSKLVSWHFLICYIFYIVALSIIIYLFSCRILSVVNSNYHWDMLTYVFVFFIGVFGLSLPLVLYLLFRQNTKDKRNEEMVKRYELMHHVINTMTELERSSNLSTDTLILQLREEMDKKDEKMLNDFKKLLNERGIIFRLKRILERLFGKKNC